MKFWRRWCVHQHQAQIMTGKNNIPIRDDDVPNADLTSPPTPVNESAPVPKDVIIDG